MEFTALADGWKKKYRELTTIDRSFTDTVAILNSMLQIGVMKCSGGIIRMYSPRCIP